MKRTAIALVPLLIMTQTACIAVGGYSSSGGWFIWPGSLGLILILVLLFFFLRGR
jgi:hypothetical protein